MMKKYVNNYGKECYLDVTLETLFSELEFYRVFYGDFDNSRDNIQYALHTNLGSLTVLNRLTGFGYRDIETGFRDMDGKFWLASGGHDVRESGVTTIGEAINWVKKYANTCTGE